jgi:hypothetical protein
MDNHEFPTLNTVNVMPYPIKGATSEAKDWFKQKLYHDMLLLKAINNI